MHITHTQPDLQMCFNKAVGCTSPTLNVICKCAFPLCCRHKQQNEHRVQVEEEGEDGKGNGSFVYSPDLHGCVCMQLYSTLNCLLWRGMC